MRARIIFFSFALLPLLLAGCTTQEATSCGNGPRLAVGDHWYYEHQFGGQEPSMLYQNVTSVTDVVRIHNTGVSGNETFTGSLELCLDGLAFVASETEGYRVTLDPPCGAVHFPIRVGDAYEETCVTQPDGMESTFTYSVEAEEVLTTELGTFDTFRVNMTRVEGDWRTLEVGWYAPEVCNWLRVESYLASVDVEGERELFAYQCSA